MYKWKYVFYLGVRETFDYRTTDSECGVPKCNSHGEEPVRNSVGYYFN